MSIYQELKSKLGNKSIMKLADVKGKVTKVAWDIVRFTDNSDMSNSLWKIENKDGEDVIVAMYPENLKTATASVKTDWEVLPDKNAITIFYKGEALKKIASDKFNDDNALVNFCSTVKNKLANDESFKKSFINDLEKVEREHVLAKYPELMGQ